MRLNLSLSALSANEPSGLGSSGGSCAHDRRMKHQRRSQMDEAYVSVERVIPQAHLRPRTPQLVDLVASQAT